MPAYLYNARKFQGSRCRHSHHRYRGPLSADRTMLYVRASRHTNVKGRWKEDQFIDFCRDHDIDLVITYSGLKLVDGNTERDDTGVLLQFHTEADALLFKLSFVQ